MFAQTRRVLSVAAVGVLLAGGSVALAASPASAATCGSTLQSWTGPLNLATYNVHYTSNNSNGLEELAEGAALGRLVGTYEVASNTLVIEGDDNGESAETLSFYQPTCNAGGRVTSARVDVLGSGGTATRVL